MVGRHEVAKRFMWNLSIPWSKLIVTALHVYLTLLAHIALRMMGQVRQHVLDGRGITERAFRSFIRRSIVCVDNIAPR